MKGPSLESIRKFKEQQERKKRQEEEKKIQDKLCTLEHRANQGDRKAKLELKRIEQIKNNHNKAPEPQIHNQKQPTASKQNNGQNSRQPTATKSNSGTKHETDFEELMKLAKQNTNEVKSKPAPTPEIKKKNDLPKSKCKPPSQPLTSNKLKKPVMRAISPKASNKVPQMRIQVEPKGNRSEYVRSQQMMAQKLRMQQAKAQPRQHAHSSYQYSSHRYEDDMDEDDYDSEDDYEADDFVVDEEDDSAQHEVSKIIRSVFRYDKRRCDQREREIDRQYRAIGKVDTFEDLEREERRASRLAAAEDARELRDEEERKKLKKLRLKKSR